jgi:hypothetical protein
MVAGLLLFAWSGVVAILGRGLFVGPIATLALFLGFAAVVMSAFYARIHGRVDWFGVKIWIHRARPKRRKPRPPG